MSELPLAKIPVRLDTLALLKLEPQNASARALVSNQVGQPIPDELTTYSAILEWIRSNTKAPVTVAPVEIDVTKTETEIGTCRYRAELNGIMHLLITPETIAEIGRRAESPNDFDDKLYEYVMEQAQDMPMDRDVDEAELDRFEPTDSDDSNVDYPGLRLRRDCRAALKAFAPDVYATLFGQDEPPGQNPEPEPEGQRDANGDPIF